MDRRRRCRSLGLADDLGREDNVVQYFEIGFSGGWSPDVVLIDGRFRVACFLTCLLMTSPGTKIVFDDYTENQRYHLASEIVTPSRVGERQALFVRPESLDEIAVRDMRDRFTYVME